jgi:hypothetical protein
MNVTFNVNSSVQNRPPHPTPPIIIGKLLPELITAIHNTSFCYNNKIQAAKNPQNTLVFFMFESPLNRSILSGLQGLAGVLPMRLIVNLVKLRQSLQDLIF